MEIVGDIHAITHNWPNGLTGNGVRFTQTHIDEIGNRYGRIVIIGYAYQNKHTGWKVLGECDCGNSCSVDLASLRKGHTKSCGCVNTEQRKVVIKKAKIAQLKMWTKEYTEKLSKRLFSNYKSSAKHRGIDFLINFEQFNSIAKQNCFYCGEPPNIRINKEKRTSYCGKEFLTNGVDRKDNAEGYTEINSVACCPMCNRMKNKYGFAEFINKCKKISERF